MTVGEKLRYLRKQQGLTQMALARKAGIVQSSISDIETSNRVLNISQMQKICAALQVPISELLDEDNIDDSMQTLTLPREYSLLSERQRRLIDDLILELSSLSTSPKDSESFKQTTNVSAHILGYAAAGSPLYAMADPDETALVPKKYADSTRFRIVRARGDSMEPRIHSGDIVVAAIDTPPEPGQIALVRLAGLADDEYVIKRVTLENGRYILRSDNPTYPPMTYAPEDVRACEAVRDVFPRK